MMSSRLSVSQMSPVKMLIDLKIHNMCMDNDIVKCYLHMYVRHPDFTICLRHAAAAALLAPNIPAYVQGLTIQFTKYLEENVYALLGVPAESKSDPADWMLIKNAINTELTSLRSVMKLKIDTSIKNEMDIYELTASLMMYDLRPKKEHWGRFARTPDYSRGT
ncbi:hypothetical protein BC628DRAFT_1100788 [Trametes gibbosa]|nr:hypothetical protein BC628DRAFT_1202777 [Trametes gibbosa]KAI0816948.1 hypothetical protein BC628DRAFT_1100788 [Trametes gibbosa]